MTVDLAALRTLAQRKSSVVHVRPEMLQLVVDEVTWLREALEHGRDELFGVFTIEEQADTIARLRSLLARAVPVVREFARGREAPGPASVVLADALLADIAQETQDAEHRAYDTGSSGFPGQGITTDG